MIKTSGYAATDPAMPLGPWYFDRRDPGPQDVHIEILYCGVCHSDLHMARNEWGMTRYPIVPGHEIVGRVIAAGKSVRKFRPGDLAAVGCMVDSCRKCDNCRADLEQYCLKDATFTYNSEDPHTGKVTYGGYSTQMVVNEHFVLRVPPKLDLAATAPLLCAGITTYSPLRHWRIGPGHRVGIVGLGGLGHMGVKLARALGAEVVLFTTSPGKVKDGKRMGAEEVIVSTRPEDLKKHAASLDFILDTVAAPHNLDSYTELLRRDGTLCLAGLPDAPHPSPGVGNLLFMRRRIAGSLIGGIRETQEMLDFCGQHGIVSDIELIPIQQINDAYARMLKSEVKYRFVIDMASLGH